MRNLGIIHAISVSGLHVALVYSAISRFLRYKKALIVVTLYVILTGAAFSSIRALIMIYILVFAKIVKRNYKPLIALLISAAFILILKPYAIFNLGFILSYGATLGIILFSDSIRKKVYFLPSYLCNTIAVSLSSQIFTIPILIYSFNYLSLSFIIGNILIVPILNIIIILGNILIPLVTFKNIFDFFSFIILKMIQMLDWVMGIFYDIGRSIYIANKNISIVYCFIIISFFFIKRGYKRFYLVPCAAMISLAISFYSPIPKVNYIQHGVFLLSYKGERVIISNKNNLDVSIIKKANLAQKVYREEEKIYFTKNIIINRDKDDYILTFNNNEYCIKLNNKSEIKHEYDIIDFVNERAEVFFIFNNKIFVF